ncbi:hypothetical protein PMI42_04806 [Bradyrhizobium sp. YR681]|uniref:hypothetical protein n=1 Tax=Bradyrhizobium sp. YR681 TaxID=1144344 RepID=UPI00027105C6|nr:hypothetical protein [Bradyrhizobium sp. YR681]EJN11793.1 hypothetical protein PMI42_04806 [Bradyrhizobium sp. YR681]
MSIVSISMACALQRDLMARGVRHLDLDACEAMVAGMLHSIVTIERGTREDEDLPQRCATDEVDLDGSCLACGAVQGEVCRQPGCLR